jgi:hypothetical protein
MEGGQPRVSFRARRSNRALFISLAAIPRSDNSFLVFP